MYPRKCKTCGRTFYAPDEFFDYCCTRCRILADTHREGDCVIYHGKETDGMLITVKYGQTKRRLLPLDQLIYEDTYKVKLGEHEHIEHTCGHDNCLNPQHMRLVVEGKE